MKRLAAALGLLAALATNSLAANSTVFDSIATVSTYHNIGIKVYYHGDDDSDMTVSGGVTRGGVAPAGGLDTLTWFSSRKNGADNICATQNEGATVTDIKKYWATSINMCGADSLFDVYVDVVDADAPGCTSCPTDFTAKVSPTVSPRTLVNNTTARMVSVSALGKQVWMSSKGSDSNTGLSRSSPVCTFTKAISLCSTQGDQIRLISDGVYYTMRTDSLNTGIDTHNGTGSKYYSVVGDSAGVTISGADTTALDASQWLATFINPGGTGPFLVYAHYFTTRATWPRTVILGDSLRLYPYKKLADFRSDPLGVITSVGCYWFNNDGTVVYLIPPAKVVPRGSIIFLNTLLQDGDPAWLKNTVRVATKSAALRLESAFWRVDSLTFRDFGTGRDLSITWSVVNLANQGNVVENCVFQDLGRPAVGFRGYFDATTFRSNWNTVQKCSFISHTFGTSWDGPSDHFIGYDKMAGQFPTCQGAFADTNCYEEMVVFPTIILEFGRAHVIRQNYFYGGSDAAVRWTNVNVDTVTTKTTDVDVYQNNIIDMGDDVFECDGTSGINDRIYKNMVLGGNDLANFYVVRGPTWLMFNTAINTRTGLLPRGNSPFDEGIPKGHMVVANNTFASRCVPGFDLFASGQFSSKNSYVNLRFVNNIISASGARTIWEGGSKGLNEFNWNIHHRFQDSTFDAAVHYSAVGHDVTTLKAWRDSTYGYGANDGRTSTLQFGDSANWDWAPKSTWSQVLGKLNARSLPGVNTNTIKHMSPAWKVNTSGSSDSTYVGAWKVNGYRLETTSSGGAGSSGVFRRRPHRTEEESAPPWRRD